MFFKNGVPIGYVEVLSLFERMEVGFNLYYTFREGESAWLYAQVLKFCRERYGVTCFSIDHYQLGHENEEAIASGAFWVYRKLGFHSTLPEIARLIEKEEVRRTRCRVCLRCLLAFVIAERKGKAELLRHLSKTGRCIIRILICIVRADRNDAHIFALIIMPQLR